jgi:hypothetical protein
MWILLRLVIAALGFGCRLFYSDSRRPSALPGPDQRSFNGRPDYLWNKMGSGKDKDKVVRLSIGMALTSPREIRMHRESVLDFFVKRIGIAVELQTGDSAFDELVYVTSDHPGVKALLTSSAPLRAAILRAFELGARRVRYDGKAVWLDDIPEAVVTTPHLETLAALWKASAPLSQEPPHWFADRFLWKALVIESVAWGIAGYAAGSVLEHFDHVEDLHVWTGALIGIGCVVALLMFAAMLAAIVLVMRGSSRGHRIVIESALLLAIGLPLAGIQLVADVNRALDDSPTQSLKVRVARCDVYRGKGRRSYSLVIDDSTSIAPPAPEWPSKIQVSRRLCDALVRGGDLEVELGAGYLGLPWYRQLRARDVTWTAPF